MDMPSSSTLFMFMKNLDRGMIIEVAMHTNGQILAGVAYCHGKCVAHRNLKPENIMVMECDGGLVNVKIADLSLAVESTKACTDFVGTKPFIAPECAVRSSSERYDPASADVWACGVMFLEILCGIGKMSRMLRWHGHSGTSLQYRQLLESFFISWRRFTESIEADIGQVGSASFPRHTHASLVGMLTPDPIRRWDAMKVIGCSLLS